MIMNAKVPFHHIKVNKRQNEREIIFFYEENWYRLDWAKVPEKFKILYVAFLKLQGSDIPNDLKEFEKDIIDISDTNIEIDLDACEKISTTYPL